MAQLAVGKAFFAVPKVSKVCVHQAAHKSSKEIRAVFPESGVIFARQLSLASDSFFFWRALAFYFNQPVRAGRIGCWSSFIAAELQANGASD